METGVDPRYITKIVNLSLESGVFAKDWKNALVHPLVKKAGLPPINKNLRPVSNLQFTSKIIYFLRHFVRIFGTFFTTHVYILRTR